MTQRGNVFRALRMTYENIIYGREYRSAQINSRRICTVYIKFCPRIVESECQRGRRSGWRPICNPQDQLHDVDMFHLSKSEAMCLPFLVALSGSLILHVVTGQQWVPNTGCDYQQDVVPDRTYYVYSPNYPSLYPRGIQCRWIARAPTRSKIVLNCSSFSLPFSSNCQTDQFRVSLTGRRTDFHKYCGGGSFNLESESNQMLIELASSYYTESGSFACSLTVTSQVVTPPRPCDCGWKKESRIVNGYETGINEYPMMAGLVSSVTPTGLFCGCTIISDRWVITAAHCLLNKFPANTGVLVGDHDISIGNETDKAHLYIAENFIGHPEYNSASQINDIALVKTRDYMTFSLEVGPACLPFRYPELPSIGEKVQVLGWGTIAQSEEKSQVLLGTQLDVIDIETCQSKFNNVTNKQICTYTKGTDSCQADSGGPLLVQGADRRVRLFGIISYGKGCATTLPGVNTRVGSYLHWILEATQDEVFCVR